MIIAASFDVSDPELWLNRGLSYGDGVFETMRLHKDGIPLFDFHMRRLNASLKKLILSEFDPRVLDDALLNHVDCEHDKIVKLIVFRSFQQRTYTPQTKSIDWVITLEQLPEMNFNHPLKLQVCQQPLSQQPNLAGIKHLSRLEQVILASELNELDGVDDLLLCDHQNHIIETTYQNILFIKDKRIITPSLDRAGVHGVALRWLQSQYTVHSDVVKIDDLADFEGVMVCNSIRGFNQIQSIRTDKKQCISFGTSAGIHDKISNQWDALFNT